MKKSFYTPPCAEEVYLALEGMLAQSDETSGMLEDMTGNYIYNE